MVHSGFGHYVRECVDHFALLTLEGYMPGQAPKEFISKLRAGTVRPPLAIIGMAKASEDSDHSLMFSAGGCENWIEIPEQAISEIHTLGMVPCKDHQHPRVRIELVPSDDPTVSALSAVLTQIISSRQQFGTVPSGHQHGVLTYAHPLHVAMRRSHQ